VRLKLALCLIPTCYALAAASPARADEKESITAEQVARAIARGVKFLKDSQSKSGRDSGTWTDNPAIYHGGLTPLCTLALLNCGCTAEDETVKRALNYLRNLRPTTTYSLSLQTMVFCAADPVGCRTQIRRNVKILEDTQVKDGPHAGAWSYPNPMTNRGDNSNTQFALLALYEAERVDVPVNDAVWARALEHWKKQQNADGSWGYEAGWQGTGSMTNAGIASLIITQGEVNTGDSRAQGDEPLCCGTQQSNEAVENGLNWMERNFSVYRNPGPSANWLYYYLYGLERTGRMTARRFIGDHDWYREGAKMLVTQQENLTGAWPDTSKSESDPLLTTCFALLFLSKGQRPVVMAHLQHGPENDWNHHRSALFNLVSYTEKVWHRDLTYQVIDPRKATVEDLLETPVLYISGREAPQFSAEEKLHLRQYVDRGGFIFAEQCCGETGFDTGFRALMKDIFPEPELNLHLLPIEHPVWYTEERIDPNYMPELYGIDVGCRTSVVYSKTDLSCRWELARPGREKQYNETLQAKLKAARSAGINVLAYATNREVQVKDPQLRTPIADAAKDPLQRGMLYVANVKHPGGCDAAPGALGNLMRTAAENLKVRASAESHDVRLTDPQLFQYHLLFLHGRTTFRLTPAERKQLRLYIERGGMIFADSICSSKQFTESFRRELKSVFPEQTLERISVKHPLFTTEFGGSDLSTVSRRQPEAAGAADPLKSSIRKTEPYLEGLMFGDRYGVIFSPYDISCALESHESLECEGYIKQDAGRIGINVLLYSLNQ
jgi:hypothetical protein